jgi:folylpolyglutamate synthase
MIFLVALEIFASQTQSLHVIILEVGMGGRYDATNVFDHSYSNTVCGVSLIDYDHQRVLGDSLELIAREKGGIFRKNKCPLDNCILTDDSEEEKKYFTIESNQACVISVLQDCVKKEGANAGLFICRAGDNIPSHVTLGLAGNHQRLNAELAIAMCESMNKRFIGNASRLDSASHGPLVESALGKTFFPGRCQTIEYMDTPALKLILRCDGAHTQQSIKACLGWFQTVSGYHHISDDKKKKMRALIFCCSNERDPVTLLRPIHEASGDKPLFQRIYFCNIDSARHSVIERVPIQQLLERCGTGVGEKHNSLNSHTWTESLALVWNALDDRCEKSPQYNRSDISVRANITVMEALDHVRLWALSVTEKEESIEIDICVTGSLYIVGSALAAIGWKEHYP